MLALLVLLAILAGVIAVAVAGWPLSGEEEVLWEYVEATEPMQILA